MLSIFLEQWLRSISHLDLTVQRLLSAQFSLSVGNLEYTDRSL